MNGSIPDYQSSAMLMAILLNGMDEDEVYDLTIAMANSGDIMDWSELDRFTADKHSTGGVGDKVSLILVPLMAECGINMVKMSGRGLGHTGGTVDKMESIRGFRPELSEGEVIRMVKLNGAVMASQSADLAPADKILYSLRDSTSTVDSIPLIASSIMSKKIAAGTDCIVIDVKYGAGAFMKDIDSARVLGDTMVYIGNRYGKKVSYILSDMDEPLGYCIGNSIEVMESVDTLRGKGPSDLRENVVDLGVEILIRSGYMGENRDVIREKLYSILDSGAAFERFKKIVREQGGDIGLLDDFSLFKRPNYTTPVYSRKSGKIVSIDSHIVGVVAMKLGAGRKFKGDSVDYSAGIRLNKKVGDEVVDKELICSLYHDIEIDKKFIDELLSGFEIV